MKINGNEIRIGHVLEHQKKLWSVIKTEHVKPGKGPAYLQTQMRCITDGSKLHERFRSSETVERVRLEQKNYQYLFGDDTSLTFMDHETYEQLSINKTLMGDDIAFLNDEMNVVIEFYESTPLSVALPTTVVLEVAETEPIIKGQTAASSNKPAIMTNGIRVMVPPFIIQGEKIIVNTAERTYNARAD